MSTSLSSEDFLIQTILAQLTSSERSGCAVYLGDTLIPAGTLLEFPHISMQAPWNARVAFVDRDPMANWSHSCRYMLVNPESGQIHSYEAQLPPFQPGQSSRWQVIFKAASVPNSVLYHNP
jgi:hypothetical protein